MLEAIKRFISDLTGNNPDPNQDPVEKLKEFDPDHDKEALELSLDSISRIETEHEVEA